MFKAAPVIAALCAALALPASASPTETAPAADTPLLEPGHDDGWTFLIWVSFSHQSMRLEGACTERRKFHG